jgi:hypothetical protein
MVLKARFALGQKTSKRLRIVNESKQIAVYGTRYCWPIASIVCHDSQESARSSTPLKGLNRKRSAVIGRDAPVREEYDED